RRYRIETPLQIVRQCQRADVLHELTLPLDPYDVDGGVRMYLVGGSQVLDPDVEVRVAIVSLRRLDRPLARGNIGGRGHRGGACPPRPDGIAAELHADQSNDGRENDGINDGRNREIS